MKTLPKNQKCFSTQYMFEAFKAVKDFLEFSFQSSLVRNSKTILLNI